MEGMPWLIVTLLVLLDSVVDHVIDILFYSISAIPLGTCEKAKACEYRES